ncbi:tRNA dihydrouridine(20/20a) synthase DusA [Psittacicella hinzii]|uniref:tRNA dihydrouridine(20/20a) synthase DusA n=1 Tax=Psittacicella hinzii TaxID=2028575 RepID=A0A3A1YC33_9GAMM|nr:tRNA dihydrouridine(20/20a) synthase DusA [Psittacicella hinzii]RIY35692.1 tRNA dihydrouridine(20/20a) synthase DusA [Psittacicella hinzii]
MTKAQNFYDQRFSVAPMLDWTTRYCRAFHRQLSKHAVLYTEMVATSTILHSKSDYLFFNPENEGNVVLQLGGSDPKQFAQVGKMLAEKAELYPYYGININVGCPSPRVTSGSFGACLMAEPDLVAQCADALLTSCDIPVSIKTRIGIDDYDDFDFLADFLDPLVEIGISDFTIHARKALLNGLSPKENREIPPLNYQRVYDLKDEFPDINITINGGINTLYEASEHLKHVEGVMMGREAFNNPAVLLGVDALLFDDYANDFSRYHGIFDDTLTLDHQYAFFPDSVNLHADSHDSFTMRVAKSISGGRNLLSTYDPLLEKLDLLTTLIHKKAAERLEQGLTEKRAFALEMLQHKREPGKHAPKSHISDAARFKRAQQIATGQAMFDALERLRPYWEKEVKRGVAISHLFKPVLGAFNGLPGAKQFRRYLSIHGFNNDANLDVLLYAIDLMYDKFLQFIESSVD